MQTRVLGGEGGRRGFFGGTYGRSRVIGLSVVGIAGSFATILLQGPGLAATVVAVAVVYAVTIRTRRGTPWARWRAGRRWRERQRLGTTTFIPVQQRPEAVDPTRVRRRERKAVTKQWRTYRDWPDGAEGMHWLQKEVGKPGIAWHAPTGEDAYLSVCFAVEGQVRGIESDRYLDEAARLWGQALARLGSGSSLANRAQSITRVLPVDTARHEAWVWQHLDEDNASSELITSYDEVVQLLSTSGLMQRHYVVIRWPLTPAFTAAAARRGPAQQGWRALMATEIDSMTTLLRRAKLGVRPEDVSALSATGLAAVLRHMQNPSWPIDQGADLDVDAPWMASVDELSATKTTSPGPDGTTQQWWHRTALLPVEAFETGPRTSLWTAPLLSQLTYPIVRTLSLQDEVVPATAARPAAKTDVTTDLADIEAQKEKGVLTDAETEERLAAARARLVDLRPGSGHHGAGWAGHLTISAQTREDLVEATSRITEAAGNAGIEYLEWLDGVQAGAAASTWPLARGMAAVNRGATSVLREVFAGSGSKQAI